MLRVEGCIINVEHISVQMNATKRRLEWTLATVVRPPREEHPTTVLEHIRAVTTMVFFVVFEFLHTDERNRPKSGVHHVRRRAEVRY